MPNNTMENIQIEIIKDRLYFLISDKPPKSTPKACFFNIDNDLVYDAYSEDFGPLNLAMVWKFTCEMDKLMRQQKYKNYPLYHQSSTDYKKHTNAALLMCCSQMILCGRTADQMWEHFKHIQLKPFRDASPGECSYECTMLDCLKGLEYAMRLDWFNYHTFDLGAYEHYEQIENGDINWIIPNKFVAFSSPSAAPNDEHGNRLCTPKDYARTFKQLGIDSVIRLNSPTYDRREFVESSISHHDLYFMDGTSPPKDVLDKFFKTVECERVFGIHCKAGLGRTGCLIGCYAMKHYFFSAAYFIAWIRLCRPGSILGPQQHFLISMEKEMKEAGIASPIWKQVSTRFDEKELTELMKTATIRKKKMSHSERIIEKFGDDGQGEWLVSKKKEPVRG